MRKIRSTPKEACSTVLTEIRKLCEKKGRILVAIDGRCASGKTTLASLLSRKLSCNLIHTDSFYLRENQRTKERLAEPGGNVDYERFRSEVLLPLKAGTPFSYRPYDCHLMQLLPPVSVSPAPVELIEGTYSCRPDFVSFYDLRIFLTVEKEEQMKRIIEREGKEKAKRFGDTWIPLEEKYFSSLSIDDTFELVFDME